MLLGCSRECIDSLLAAAMTLLDLQDVTTVNKVLEEEAVNYMFRSRTSKSSAPGEELAGLSSSTKEAHLLFESLISALRAPPEEGGDGHTPEVKNR